MVDPRPRPALPSMSSTTTSNPSGTTQPYVISCNAFSNAFPSLREWDGTTASQSVKQQFNRAWEEDRCIWKTKTFRFLPSNTRITTKHLSSICTRRSNRHKGCFAREMIPSIANSLELANYLPDYAIQEISPNLKNW